MCYWSKICFKENIDLLDISRYLDISTTYLTTIIIIVIIIILIIIIIIIIINILIMCMF